LNVIPSASSLRKATSRHVNLRVWQRCGCGRGGASWTSVSSAHRDGLADPCFRCI